MKKIISVVLLGTTFIYAETSAFGAGNLTSNSPYGLTSNEKIFKEKLDTLSNEYSQVNATINQTNERLEGLQSMLEGINAQYSKSNSRLSQLETGRENFENNFTLELQNLKKYVEESRKIQDTHNKQVKKILAELSSLVDSINANYVAKNEFNDLNSSPKKNFTPNSVIIDDNLTSDTNEELKENKPIDESWKKKKSSEILDLAIKDSNNNLFDEAKAKLNHLISINYKPARATFWLGEIEYKQKNYNNAIVYYKKSSAISTKGNYIPKLLYHTAISLDKVGDTKSANGFYKALKTSYPNSPEAKASPNRK